MTDAGHEREGADGPPSAARRGTAARAALESLRERLGREVGEALSLRAFEERAPEIDAMLSDLDAQLARVSRAAVLCLVGSTGAGKSTLLNALVGRRVAREGVDRPTTSAPVVYRPADADVSEVVVGLPGAAPEVVTYEAPDEASAGAAFWRGQVLVDAPDVNSVEALHRDVVGELAARSDVLVVVAHRQSIAELSSASFVDLFAGRRGLVFVLGRADELDDASRESLLEQLRALRDERWARPDAPVLALSARVSQADPEAGGVRALQDAITRLIADEKLGSIRRRNALGDVARIAALGQEVAPAVGAGVRALDGALESGAARWAATLESAVRERLDVRRADLAQLLWNDAAKGWDGPGGYALKVGGLSALGMGAGAAVARRNPVLAAGLAVGSVAADRVRGAVRERQMESTSGLLPAATEVEAVQREAFREARLAAADLLVRDEAASMAPDGPELDERAARAVDDAWDRMLRVDLPKAAQASVGRILKGLIDVPIYALGAFVLFRVVVGFFDGAYVGLDFLTSAVIMALGWMFLARLSVRARLSARSGALLSGVREDVSQRLGVAAEAAVSARRERLRTLGGRAAELARADETWRSRLHGET